MNSSPKSFFYHGSVFWVGKMLSRAVSFVLLPIYTAYIAPAEYGTLSILAVIMDISMLVLGFQLPVAIYRFYARTDSAKEKEKIIGSALTVCLLLPTFFLSFVYVWNEYFARLFGVGSHPDLLRLVLFEGQVAIVWGIFLADMRIRSESTLFSALEIGQNFTVGIIGIIFVVYFGMGITGIFLAQTCVFSLLVISFFPRFLRRVSMTFDVTIVKKMLVFSLPLIPAAIAMAAVHSADRIILEKILGIGVTGIYAVGYKFGMIVNMMVLGPFLLIWQTQSFEMSKEPGFEYRFGEIFTYLVACASFVALSLTGLSSYIVGAMAAPSYIQAADVVPLIAWSYVFFAMSSVANAGLLIHHKTKTISVIVFVVFTVNIVGNVILIPSMGMIGAAVATLISFVVHFGVTLICSMYYVSIKFEIKKILVLAALIALSLLAFFVLDGLTPLFRLVCNSTVLVFFGACLLFSGFFDSLRIQYRLRKAFGRIFP